MSHSFDRRKLEVFFAMLTAGFGLWLLFPSVALDLALVYIEKDY